jgi:hypothetical protein
MSGLLLGQVNIASRWNLLRAASRFSRDEGARLAKNVAPDMRAAIHIPPCCADRAGKRRGAPPAACQGGPVWGRDGRASDRCATVTQVVPSGGFDRPRLVFRPRIAAALT